MKPVSITNRPKRKPRPCGSVLNCGVTDFELAEYRQNGCIRIKDFVAEDRPFMGWNGVQYKRINFASVLGGREITTIPEDWDIPLSSRVIDTEDYGLIAVIDDWNEYIVQCREESSQPYVSRLLNVCGYDTIPYYGGRLRVRKEPKSFLSYDDWKREQKDEKQHLWSKRDD